MFYLMSERGPGGPHYSRPGGRRYIPAIPQSFGHGISAVLQYVRFPAVRKPILRLVQPRLGRPGRFPAVLLGPRRGPLRLKPPGLEPNEGLEWPPDDGLPRPPDAGLPAGLAPLAGRGEGLPR